MGWMGTEIGRQHWIVYGLMRTENGCSASVGAPQVLGTLIGLSCIYIVIFLVFLKLIRVIVKDGTGSAATGER
jgi:cytochrome d ubiquinol oxidase subunit I